MYDDDYAMVTMPLTLPQRGSVFHTCCDQG